MARINRSDVIQKAVNDLALQPAADKIPSETLDKVQLVYYLNKQFSSFAGNATATTNTAATITLPSISAGGETFITGIHASYVKDSTCDIAIGQASITLIPAETNVAVAPIKFPLLTLTAQQESEFLSFPYPIKVKNASAVTFSTGTYTVGLLSRSVSVTGFTTSSN